MKHVEKRNLNYPFLRDLGGKAGKVSRYPRFRAERSKFGGLDCRKRDLSWCIAGRGEWKDFNCYFETMMELG